MTEFDEFDDQDDLVLAYLNQEQHQQTCEAPSPTQQDPTLPYTSKKITPAKRDRIRSRTGSPSETAGTVIRRMRPKTKVEVSDKNECLTASHSIERKQQPRREVTVLELQDDEVPVALCKKGEACQNEEEETVIWPPSQTFASDALKLQAFANDKRQTSVNGHGNTHFEKPVFKREATTSIDVKPGKAKATVKNLDIKRDAEGNVTEIGKQAITKHLLNTLGDKHNPITNSDLYRR